MRTLMARRRQQLPAQDGTEPEIEEIIQGEIPPLEEKIYVAVGKDLSESVNALKWALRNLANRQAALVILLHVQLSLRSMPSPMGKIPLNRVSKDVLKAYKKDVKKELKKSFLNKYLDICTRAMVKAELLIVEKDDVSKGIVEEVAKRGITKLIMGTSSTCGAMIKKMKMQAPGKADYVKRHAIESCEVSIVCKEKIVLLREGSPLQDVAAQESDNYRSPSFDSPARRTETAAVEPSRDDIEQLFSSPQNCGGNSDIYYQTLSNVSVTGDCTPAWREEVNDSEITAPKNELSCESVAAESPEMYFDEDYPRHIVEPRPQGTEIFPPDEEASRDIETLKLKLKEALEVAENAKKEVQTETAKRKKAEAIVVETNLKLKNLDAVFKETAKEREEATSLLKLQKEQIRRQRNEAEEELQAMVEKLTSLATKVNQLSREREEAIKELEAARQKLARMEEQNYSILQEKDAQIKHLQDCLHSRPRIEPPTASSSAVILEFCEYSPDDIKSATCNFAENFKIGEGGYGTVYIGQLRQTTVAVKILKEDSLQGRREFHREIDILRDIRHPHLVRVVGACFERDCILYEYMSNGCLADRLSCKNATPPLPWQARIRIAAEVCSALQFLHSYKPDSIVHHDLKPENILLDENYVSKISDFGLARFLPQDLRTESEAKGTFCYMDPEYLTSGEYSTKSDVFSLGIIILQLLTGKSALGLAKEVEHALKNGKLDQILDPSAGEWPFVHATQLTKLALYCTESIREKRPDLQPTVMKTLDQLRNFAVAASNPGTAVKRGQTSVQAAEEIHVPSFFLCPVFKEVMQDPCVASDGFTYEKEAIQGWFDSGRDTSPLTNKKLVQKNLIPNFSLRSAIRQWQERGDFL